MRALIWLLLPLAVLSACDDTCNCTVEVTEDTGDVETDTDTTPCSDVDGDGVCDDADLCDGHDVSGDTDNDGTCDDIDQDDDNDGVVDKSDIAPTYAYVCADSDGDGCEDCRSGTFAPDDDGDDWDTDGLCDTGDDDDDNDGVDDASDAEPFDPYVCSDTDEDTCEDCISGSYDPAADGDDWDGDGVCDAVDPERFEFASSQKIDGQTITCSSFSSNTEYTECSDLQVGGLYFPNGIDCGPTWSTTESRYTSHADFCELLTGSRGFEVYYTCDTSQTRVSYAGGVWGTYQDNGYTQDIRCDY